MAQECASGQSRDDLFAGTPSLTAAKYVISEVASQGANGPGDWRIMVLDIKRAFLYGDIEDDIYIDLPDEDPMKEWLKRMDQHLRGELARPNAIPGASTGAGPAAADTPAAAEASHGAGPHARFSGGKSL